MTYVKLNGHQQVWKQILPKIMPSLRMPVERRLRRIPADQIRIQVRFPTQDEIEEYIQ